MKTKNGNKRGRRKGSKLRPKAVSAATMAIFAASCAAFQSSPTQCRIGIGTGPVRPKVALQYRYGNDTNEIPIRMQAEADSNSIEKTTKSRPVWRIVSLPHLTFLKTASVPSHDHDDQQNVMDEYLEYVDRRYSRILENSVSVYSSPQQRPKVLLDFQVPRKIFFSTLALQRRRSVQVNTSKPAVTSSPGALAELNALGLSNLASARLRQRLQAPRDLRDEFSAASYFFTSHSSDAVLAPQMEAAAPSPAPVESSSTRVVDQPTVGGRVSLFSGVGPIAQYQLMVQTLRKFIQAFVTSIMIMANFASRVIPQILEKGGFRHSVRALTGATLALLFMFKPLFKGAMKS